MKTKRFISAILAMAMLMSLMPAAFADTGAGLSGNGDSASPYLIGSEGELQELASLVNGGTLTGYIYVELTNDIELSGLGPWTPIGTSASPFFGSFDGSDGQGGRYRISGLGIDSSEEYQGLFGVIAGGVSPLLPYASPEDYPVVSNLIIEDAFIMDQWGSSAVLAGRITNGAVSRVDVVDSVNRGSQNVAARGATGIDTALFVAQAQGSVFTSCAARGQVGRQELIKPDEGYYDFWSQTGVTNAGNAGGFAAILEDCEVTDASFYGIVRVAESNAVGGIAGTVKGGSLTDVHATGIIHGSTAVGGAFGLLEGAAVERGGFEGYAYSYGDAIVGGFAGVALSSRIEGSFSHATVFGYSESDWSKSTVGGFAGLTGDLYGEPAGLIRDCYSAGWIGPDDGPRAYWSNKYDGYFEMLRYGGGFFGVSGGASDYDYQNQLTATKMINCYADVEVDTSVAAGFGVELHNDEYDPDTYESLTVVNCYYDWNYTGGTPARQVSMDYAASEITGFDIYDAGSNPGGRWAVYGNELRLAGNAPREGRAPHLMLLEIDDTIPGNGIINFELDISQNGYAWYYAYGIHPLITNVGGREIIEICLDGVEHEAGGIENYNLWLKSETERRGEGEMMYNGGGLDDEGSIFRNKPSVLRRGDFGEMMVRTDIQVELYDPGEDSTHTQGFSVEWYWDEYDWTSGASPSQYGTYLGGVKHDATAVYLRVNLGYELAERFVNGYMVAVDIPQDTGEWWDFSETVTVELIPLESTKRFEGAVTAGGQPVAGAKWYLRSDEGGVVTVAAEGVTGEHGLIMTAAPPGVYSLIVVADGFFTYRAEDIDLQNSSIDDMIITLEGIPEVDVPFYVELDITARSAALPGEAAHETRFTDYHELDITLSAGAVELASGYRTGGSRLYVQDEDFIDAAKAHGVTAALVLLDGEYTVLDAAVTGQDGAYRLTAELVQNGGVSIEVRGADGSTAMFYRDGRLAASCKVTGGGVQSGPLTAGLYDVVIIEPQRGISWPGTLDGLTAMGLALGRDCYYAAGVAVSDGVITVLGPADVPALDTAKVSMLDYSRTYLQSGRGNLPVGASASASLRATIYGDRGETIDEIRLALPAGISVLDGDISLNGRTDGFTLRRDGQDLYIIPSDRALKTAQVKFFFTPTDEGIFRVDTYVTGAAGAKETVQFAGAFGVSAEPLILSVPEVTAVATFKARGAADPGTEITLYQNGKQMHTQDPIIADGFGMWSATLTLSDAGLQEAHMITATLTRQGRTIASKPAYVSYNENYAGLATITMLHNRQEIVLNFRDRPLAKPIYVHNGWDNSFTFLVRMNNPDMVSNVSVLCYDGDMNVTVLPAVYDEGRQAWIAVGEFDTFVLPEWIGASYDLEEPEFDLEKILPAIQDYVDATVDVQDAVDAINEFAALQDAGGHVELTESMRREYGAENAKELYEQIYLSAAKEAYKKHGIDVDVKTNNNITTTTMVYKEGGRELARVISTEEPTGKITAGSVQEQQLLAQGYKKIMLPTASNQPQGRMARLSPAHISGAMAFQKIEEGIRGVGEAIGTKITTVFNAVDTAMGTAEKWVKMTVQTGIVDPAVKFAPALTDIAIDLEPILRGKLKDALGYLDGFLNDYILGSGLSDALQLERLYNGFFYMRDHPFSALWDLGSIFLPGANLYAASWRVYKLSNLQDELKRTNRECYEKYWLKIEDEIYKQQRGHIASGTVEFFSMLGFLGAGPVAYVARSIILAVPEAELKHSYQRLVAEINKCKGEEPETKEPEEGAIPNRDPSGYVYEAVPANPLQGVKATVYFKADAQSPAVVWDAEPFAQQNPLFTDAIGWYAWDVPRGLWQVKFEKDGYETVYSDWMEVPPPRTEVNMGMKTLTPPAIESISAYGEYIEIIFNQYMKYDPADWEGELVTGVGVTVDASPESGAVAGELFIKSVRLRPQAGSFAGRLELGVPALVSYTGAQLAGTARTVDAAGEAPGEIEVGRISVPYKGSVSVGIRVLPEGSAANRTITVDNLSDALVGAPVSVQLDGDGCGALDVTGKLPGSGTISLRLAGSTLSASVEVSSFINKLAKPAASRPGGAVAKGTQITLSAESPHASIYYSDCETCPLVSAVPYTGPITIDKETRIRAFARQPGYADSDVLDVTYTIDAAGPGPGTDPSGPSSPGTDPQPGPQPYPKPDPIPDTATERELRDALGGYYADAEQFPAWALEYILKLTQAGVLNGYEDGTFRHDRTLTRAETVKIIVEALGLEIGGDTPFGDARSHWAEGYIAAALAHGLIAGVSENSFAPDAPITRQDLCLIIYRLLVKSGVEIPEAQVSIPDEADISAYAREAVLALYAMGIVSGDETGRFCPKDFASRAQAVKIICGMLDALMPAAAQAKNSAKARF